MTSIATSHSWRVGELHRLVAGTRRVLSGHSGTFLGVSTGVSDQVPEEGQIVSVRGATWAVTDVKAQGLPRSPSDETIVGTQHAVTLQNLAEDWMYDELRIIWELEVGTKISSEKGMPDVTPDGFDDPQRLAAFVDALRWGAITSADPRTLQAPFRSGVRVEAYQLEPVRRALLASRANLLLADDVGLGKTIEAGLVIQELLLRHRARSVVVVCPAGLRLKWQDEMREKFGLEFEILDSEKLRTIRRDFGINANPFTVFPRVIVSMSWLPGDRAQRYLTELYAHADSGRGLRNSVFDIMVVDEAHHVAPSSPSQSGGRRGYAVDTQRTRAVSELSRHCEHRLFLSATPHNGYTESFTALLEMIDDRQFARGAGLGRKAVQEVVVRRLKKDLVEAKGFKLRDVKPMVFQPTESEIDAYDRLASFLKRRDSAAKNSKSAHHMATMLIKKRFFSSPYAFGRTIETYLDNRTDGEACPALEYNQEIGVDADDLEEGRRDQREAEALRLTARAMPPLTEADIEDLSWLAAWGKEYSARPDSRVDRVLVQLEAVLRPDGKNWTNERIVIFTEYVDTLSWIKSILDQRGYVEVLEVIEGSTDPEERELIRARFQEDPSEDEVRILLATDAAGEGIDLQNYCHRLINFDVPFNPNRLEQRIGRIDRYGQTDAPQVFHLLPERAADDDASAYERDVSFLARIATKIAAVEEDLGSVNQVIAEELQEQLAGKKITSGPRRKDDQVVNEALQGERDLRSALTNLERDFEESRDRLHIRPDNLIRVVSAALELDNQPPLIETGDERTDERVFRIPNLSASWTPVTKGLASRLRPKQPRRVTFDDEAASGRSDLVLTHLGHPLVQRSARFLRSSLWADQSGLHRVSAFEVEGLEESVVAAVTRIVLVGKGGVRLHEDVVLAGTRLKGRALGEQRSEEILERALDGSKLTAVDSDVRTALVNMWAADGDGSLRARVATAVDRRVTREVARVEKQLAQREQGDIDRVNEVYERFGRTLQDTIRAAEAIDEANEWALFDVEKQQRTRDLARIHTRVAALNEERTREIAAVHTRYADVTSHPFVAAIVFAIKPGDVIA